MDELVFPMQSIEVERPARADAVKNRELILQTAAQLFRDKGVENITMSDIVQAARIGKGTLYRHFNNKSELCYALLDEDQRTLQQNTLMRLSSGGRPEETLCWFIDAAAQFVWRNLDFLSVIGEVNAATILFNQAHLWWQQTIFALLQRADKLLPNARKPTPVLRLRYQADTLYVMLAPLTLSFQRAQGRSVSDITDGLHQLVRSFLQSNELDHDSPLNQSEGS
jgi:AcrR family transcriptional regulator